MKSEWVTVKLKDICTINMGQSPSSSSYNEIGNGEIFYQGNKDFGSLYPSIKTYTTEPKKMANIDDVLISVRAPVGELNIANQKCCIGRGVASLRLKNNHDRFLFYSMKNSMNKLHQVSSGTTFSSINKTDLESLELLLPSLLTQKKIAHILSTLDDKIELNRKMNQTLEEMAQALFKSWFVDFDPVHAKANCSSDEELETAAKELGISKEILELFPSEFEESELGMIPNGWEVKKLEEVCSNITRGVTPKYEEGSKRYILNQKVNKGKELDLSALKELQSDLIVPDAKMAHRYDILINSLGEGTIGRIHFYTAEDKQYAVDQHMSICRAEDTRLSVYIFQSLQEQGINNRLMSEKTGSTNMTMLNISKIRAFPILLACNDLSNIYCNLIEQNYTKIFNNTIETQTLQKTRDTLLPKLLSGELDVSELDLD